VILFPLLDLALYLFVGNPVMLVTIGAVGQGLTLPMIAFAAIYLRYKHTDPRLRPGLVWTVLLFLSLLAFCVTAAYVLYDAWGKLSAVK
jgi:amino acid transporter